MILKILNSVLRNPKSLKGELLQAVAICTVLCIIVAALLLIPSALSSIASAPLVDTWYLEGTGTSFPVLTFEKDGTCLIYGMDTGITWKTVRGDLVLTVSNGETYTLKYEINGGILEIGNYRFWNGK